MRFLIDTIDEEILNTIDLILERNKSNVKKIELKTEINTDINIIICACFDEVINHVTLFDENINDIVNIFFIRIYTKF